MKRDNVRSQVAATIKCHLMELSLPDDLPASAKKKIGSGKKLLAYNDYDSELRILVQRLKENFRRPLALCDD
jgi:hypothetical protein